MPATAKKTPPPSPKQTKRDKMLGDVIIDRLRLAAEIEDLEAELASCDETIIDALGVGGTFEVPDVAQVTVTTATSHTIDLDAVTSLHRTWARKITKKVLDTTKFNLLRNAGELPADVVPLVQAKTTAPFLRITKR